MAPPPKNPPAEGQEANKTTDQTSPPKDNAQNQLTDNHNLGSATQTDLKALQPTDQQKQDATKVYGDVEIVDNGAKDASSNGKSASDQAAAGLSPEAQAKREAALARANGGAAADSAASDNGSAARTTQTGDSTTGAGQGP